MSRALVTLLTVGALIAGGGVAWAAWTSSGPGTVTARAGALTAPTATAAAWTCGSTATAPRFADSGRAVEAFPVAATTTTAPAAPLAATTTTAGPTTSAAPSTTTVTPTTSTPAPAAAATSTTTTTVAPTTTSTSGVVTGLGAAATTLSWTATGAATYQYQAATTTDFANPVAAGATGATSATVTVRAILPTTVYLRVRGVVGAWTGPWSATLTTRAGPCLL